MSAAADRRVIVEDNCGVTQKCMMLMAKVAHSSISRTISANKIPHIPTSAKLKMRYAVEDTRKVLKLFVSNKLDVGKKIQCFYNFKGGVGKTSICFQVASHLAFMGFNILVIDADPQGHLSTSFGFNNDDKFFTLHDAIAGIKEIDEIVQNIYDGLDCVPANLSLTKAEVTLNEMPKREERVRLIIDKVVDKYDFIIFDTNPTISYLNRNVITCSDIVNIIVETQAYSLNGVKLVLSDIQSFVASMMIKMPDILMFPNKYEDRTATSAEAMSVLNKYYSEYLKPDFAIRKSEEFNIANKLSKPLAFFCRHNSIAFEDVLDVIDFILNKSCTKKSE
jgi:chromosome partitioning protein